MKTTLFALLAVCDLAIIDGYEVEATQIHKNDAGLPTTYTLEWCGGDELSAFNDQELVFVDGKDAFTVHDCDGLDFQMEFKAARPNLTPTDVAAKAATKSTVDKDAAAVDSLPGASLPTIKYSVDGGANYLVTKEGVRVIFEGVDVPGEDEPGEVQFNFTHEGLITDIWVSRDASLDHNIASKSEQLTDMLGDLVEESA